MAEWLDAACAQAAVDGVAPAAAVCAVDARGELWRFASSCDEDAVFAACSLSKLPFALACAQLALDGTLDLAAPLGAMLTRAELRAHVDAAHVDAVSRCTASDVLAHRTGLPNWRGATKIAAAGGNARDARAELRAPPGALYTYSAEAFILLQLAVQRVAQEGLEALAQRLIFAPLGMRRTSYVWRDEFETGSGPRWRPRGALSPSSLHTTAADLGLLLSHVLRVLRGERADGGPLASDAGTALLTSLCAPASPPLSADGGLAWSRLGAVETAASGETRLWLWGKLEGARAWAHLDPRRGAALVVLVDAWSGARVIDAAVRRFEGVPADGRAPWGAALERTYEYVRNPRGACMLWEPGHHAEHIQRRHAQDGKAPPAGRTDREWASEMMSGPWLTLETPEDAPPPRPPPGGCGGAAAVAPPADDGWFARPTTDRLRDEWAWARNRAQARPSASVLARAPRFRVAVVGVALEANGFAPPTARRDFAVLSGSALLAACRGVAGGATLRDQFAAGFVQLLDAALGESGWEPVPLFVAEAPPGGPPAASLIREFARDAANALRGCEGLDACFCPIHGGMRATEDGDDAGDDAAEDPDGLFLAAVRDALPPGARLAGTLDLHCNLSRRTFASADLLVAHRTNPHVDAHQRGEEAACALLHLLLADARSRATGAPMLRPFCAAIRLPLVTPAVRQLTAREQPVGDAVRLAQQLLAEANGWAADDAPSDKAPLLVSASVCPGFAWADTFKNGFTVFVTALDGAAPPARKAAKALAASVAAAVWAERERFQVHLTPLSAAVDAALARGRAGELVVLCDCGDNPGAGARGNTLHVLRELLSRGEAAAGSAVGVLFDPPLASAAVRAGAGATMAAKFNEQEDDPRSGRLGPVRARVLRTSATGEFVGTRGMAAGRRVALGPSALLAVATDGDSGAEVCVVVGSAREQVLSPDYFAFVGLDLSGYPNPLAARAPVAAGEGAEGWCGGAIRVVAVKSRGHFRAGFQHLASGERVIEVDAPGLSSQVLSRFPWTGLRRPCYPLDADAFASVDVAMPNTDESADERDDATNPRSHWLHVCADLIAVK